MLPKKEISEPLATVVVKTILAFAPINCHQMSDSEGSEYGWTDVDSDVTDWQDSDNESEKFGQFAKNLVFNRAVALPLTILFADDTDAAAEHTVKRRRKRALVGLDSSAVLHDAGP